jgi:hypothetical protein
MAGLKMTAYFVPRVLLVAAVMLATVAGMAAIGNPLWAIPLKELSATRERPIFSPLRRPPLPATTAPDLKLAKSPEPERPEFSLVGTIAGDKKSFGIFLDLSANTEFRLKTGQEHKGWILREVRAREIVLEKGGETAILKLPVRPVAGGAEEEGKDLN